MSTLITGVNGQLGKALKKYYPDAKGTDLNQLDISVPQQVKDYDWSGIQTIINAAAYTQVDNAETTDGIMQSWAANAQGVANLAAVAKEKDLTLIHVSTDYVFDGSKSGSYSEQDPVNPQSVYGRTKAAGDLAAQLCPKHFILRTSWVIGDGSNFVRTMLKLAAEHDQLTVVNDQIGRPTFTDDLAKAIKYLQDSQAEFGLYNFTNDGKSVSWADLARATFRYADLKCEVKDVSTAEYSRGKDPWAPRPQNSILALDKIRSTGFEIQDWQEALEEYIKQKVKK